MSLRDSFRRSGVAIICFVALVSACDTAAPPNSDIAVKNCVEQRKNKTPGENLELLRAECAHPISMLVAPELVRFDGFYESDTLLNVYFENVSSDTIITGLTLITEYRNGLGTSETAEATLDGLWLEPATSIEQWVRLGGPQARLPDEELLGQYLGHQQLACAQVSKQFDCLESIRISYVKGVRIAQK